MRKFILNTLPLLLVSTGIASMIVFIGAAFLSMNNPLAVALFLVGGIGLGGVIAGIGVLLECALEIVAGIRQIRADVRAQTQAAFGNRDH